MFFCPKCDNTFDISQSTSQRGGGKNLGSLIEKIVEGQTVGADDLKDITIKKLVDSSDYKKLSLSDKEKVYNFVSDKVGDKSKVLAKDKFKISTEAYFSCTNCGYSKKMEEGTKIFSRTDDVTSVDVDTDYKGMADSDILPRTRNYNCANSKCPSHKDPMKREAVFFRKSGSYKLVYICRTCKTVF